MIPGFVHVRGIVVLESGAFELKRLYMQCLRIQSKVNISLETRSRQSSLSRGSIRLWRSSLERGAFVHFCLSLLKFCLVTGVLRSYEQGFWVTSRDCRVSNGNEGFYGKARLFPAAATIAIRGVVSKDAPRDILQWKQARTCELSKRPRGRGDEKEFLSARTTVCQGLG